jgi:hypothetical protein
MAFESFNTKPPEDLVPPVDSQATPPTEVTTPDAGTPPTETPQAAEPTPDMLF